MEFKYITNPDTNRKCLLKSPTGRRVLKNYLNYQSGGRVTKLQRVTGHEGVQANASALHSSTGSACSPLKEDDCRKHPACSWGKHGRSSVMSCGRKAQGEGLAKARAVRAQNVAARKAESATSSRAASPVAPKKRGRKPKSPTYESVAAEMRGIDLSPLPSVRGGPRQLGKRLQALGEEAELDCIHYPSRGTEHKKSCASQSPRCKWVKGTGCVPGEWEAGQPIPGVKKRAAKGGRRNNL